jgi:hypothetical protein
MEVWAENTTRWILLGSTVLFHVSTRSMKKTFVVLRKRFTRKLPPTRNLGYTLKESVQEVDRFGLCLLT